MMMMLLLSCIVRFIKIETERHLTNTSPEQALNQHAAGERQIPVNDSDHMRSD